MQMFLAGQWRDTRRKIEVKNPFDSSVIDTVPGADAEDVEAALAGAVDGARLMRKTSGYERYEILHRAADLMQQRVAELGRLISQEEGKMLAEGRFEASRAVETIELSAEEAKRISGEVLPLDGAPGGAGKLGFTLRVPCGVVVAITPFNFPLNLVCHKVGPALAAGNAVDRQAGQRHAAVGLAAGRDPARGRPAAAGDRLPDRLGRDRGRCAVRDARVRKISFTGSRDVGEHICRTAGLKRVTMELGSNSPLIVMPDADLNKVADATVATGYGNAGQVCISTQRVIALDRVYDDLLGRSPAARRGDHGGQSARRERKWGR